MILLMKKDKKLQLEEIEKNKSKSHQTDDDDDDEIAAEYLESDNGFDEDYEPTGKKKKASTAKKVNKKTTKKEKEFDDKVAICKEVGKQPAIYQITHRDYSNKQVREKIWQQISKDLIESNGEHMTIRQCKKIWEALRESTR